MTSNTEMAILRVIRDHPDIYEVPLRRLVSKEVSFSMSLGLLYVHLISLEREGWIARQDEPGDKARGNHNKACWHLRKAID